MIPEEKTQLLCINFSRRFFIFCTKNKNFCTNFIGNKTGTFLLLQQKGSCFYGDIYPVVL